MSGTMGDLSPEQEKALTEFKHQLTEKQLFDAARHDDHLLLRFLRARKFDLHKTMEMFTNYLNWRREKNVDDIYENFKFEEYDKVHAIYPRFYHKTDKQGRPVYFEVLGKLDLEQLFKITTRERLEKFFIYEYERLVRHRLPACSQKTGQHIEKSMTVLDLGGCSVMQDLKIKDLLQLIIHIGQNYYPETMGMTFIINAPWLFDTTWNVIKHLMDEVTVKKIQIYKTGKNYSNELFSLCEPDTIPANIGGTCKCEGGCENSDVGPWKA